MKTLGFSSVLAHMNSMDHITHSLQIYLSGILILTIFFAHMVFVQQQLLSLRAHKSLLISGWWFETCVFSIYWECHHPNWLSYFSEGWLNHQPVICFLHLSMKRACVRIQPFPTSMPVFPEGWKEPVWIYLKMGYQQKQIDPYSLSSCFPSKSYEITILSIDRKKPISYISRPIYWVIDWYWCHEDHHVLLAESRLYINGVDEFWSRSGVESLRRLLFCVFLWQSSKPFT